MPKPKDLRAAHEAAGGTVEDHMQTERWDIEVDAIYYFTSVYDQAQYTTRDAMLTLRSIDANGIVSEIPASPGDCLKRDPATNNCVGDRLVKTDLGGKNQITVRAGGDYNLLPGIFALRAGVSYEAARPGPGDAQRAQLHAEPLPASTPASPCASPARPTSRSATRTSSRRTCELQVFNGEPVSRLPAAVPHGRSTTSDPGAGVADAMGNGAWRTAASTAPRASRFRTASWATPIGPYFINAGSYFYHLDVVSAVGHAALLKLAAALR